MASGQEQDPAGLHYKDANREVSASEKTIATISGTVDKLTTKAFKWSHDNPFQFVALLVCIVIIVIIRSRERLDAIQMKHDFDNERRETRARLPQQLPLDLPQHRSGSEVGKNDGH